MYYYSAKNMAHIQTKAPQISDSDITTLVYKLVSVQIETSNCPGGIKDLSKQILEEG